MIRGYSKLDADVVVVGGGFAGVSAALSAARSGADTVLFEKQSEPGGNVTQAFVHTICGLFEIDTDDPEYVHEGFPVELSRRLIDDGLAREPENVGRVFVQPMFPENMGNYLVDYLRDRDRLDLRLDRSVTAVESSDDSLRVTVENENTGEESELRTKFLIDASGDAVTEPDDRCREVETDKLQLPSLIFLVEGMDESLTAGYGKLRLNRSVATGVKEGELPAGCESILVRPGREAGQAYVTLNLPRGMVGRYDPFDRDVLREFEAEARRRAALIVGYLRDQREELTDLSISQFPDRIGIRETRRVETRYTITEKDVLEGRSFDDEVTRSAWPIELWQKYTDAEFQYPDGPVGIPLRALVADRHPRIGVAGRCLGATHRAAGALRVLGTALATGQAIGTAAVTALDSDETLGTVDSSTVRDRIQSFDYEQEF